MATAPFQLWLDLASISTAVRTSGTVTVTTNTPHGATTGAYIQMAGATGTAGTSMNGVYQITATSGTTFTYTSSGTAGTGVTGSACISYDLLNPLINYTGAAKESALYVPTESLNFSISGDGSGASSSFQVMQDDTPSDGPWFNLIPDQSRVRLVKANTGSEPAADGSDVLFTAAILTLSAQMNGSGQGTMTDVSLQDMTSLLERVLIYTYGSRVSLIARDGIVRSNGTVTVTTTLGHGLSDGGTVVINGVINSGTAAASNPGPSLFDGTAVVSNATINTFTYTQSGTTYFDAVGNEVLTPVSGSVFSAGSGQISLEFKKAQGIPNAPLDTLLYVSGITSNDAAAQNLVNGVYGTAYQAFTPGATTPQILLTVPGTFAAGVTLDVSNAEVWRQAMVTPAGSLGANTLTVAVGKTETDVVKDALSAVNKLKGADPAFQRLFNTAGTAKIVGATNLTVKESFDIEATSLREILDTVSQSFQGADGKQRRYFVDVNGNLNYSLVDQSAKPAYATAPYKLITTGVQDPNTTTGAATLMPFDLRIGLDHQTVKAGMTTTNAGTSFTPYIVSYTDYLYPERKGSPIFDSFFESNQTDTAQRVSEFEAGRSFFLTGAPPLLSGAVTLRGAGTAAHNIYGFSAGYAQTGASTYALVNRWEPGQWVDITCAELGLSGLYRIEQVDWTLERGSLTQIITLIFSYKPQYSLSSRVAQVK